LATGELIAVKLLRVRSTAGAVGPSGGGSFGGGGSGEAAVDPAVQRVRGEVELIKGLHHPNIVRYLGAELYSDDLEHRLYILQVQPQLQPQERSSRRSAAAAGMR
jgi:serine/threonine protein kinase